MLAGAHQRRSCTRKYSALPLHPPSHHLPPALLGAAAHWPVVLQVGGPDPRARAGARGLQPARDPDFVHRASRIPRLAVFTLQCCARVLSVGFATRATATATAATTTTNNSAAGLCFYLARIRIGSTNLARRLARAKSRSLPPRISRCARPACSRATWCASPAARGHSVACASSSLVPAPRTKIRVCTRAFV
jgi:hypothetical protein